MPGSLIHAEITLWFLTSNLKSTCQPNFQAYNRKAPSEFIQVIGTCHLVFVAPVDFTSRQAKTSKFRTNSRGAPGQDQLTPRPVGRVPDPLATSLRLLLTRLAEVVTR